MTKSGWYPDPAGGTDKYRYWDGENWTDHTSGDPSSIPSGPKRKTSQESWAPLLIAIAAFVAIAIALWFVLGNTGGGGGPGNRPHGGGVAPDTNSAKPTVSAWNELDPPTPPPTTGASLQSCPYSTVNEGTDRREGDRLYSGDLSVEMVPGWSISSMYLGWTSEFITQTDHVRPGWMSNMGIGVLNAEDGFTDARVSARQTMQCYASSGYYENFVSRTDVIDQEFTTGGFRGWHIRAEVRIESANMPEIEGDTVDVIVIDTGNPDRMGLYIASITIGDTERQQLADQAMSTLRVER